MQFGDELRSARKVTVLFKANLLKIATEYGTHVTRLECATLEEGKLGRYFYVEVSTTYTLAMGGIETVRTLKLSGDLGNNGKGQLGRGFMVHPLVPNAAKVRFAQPIESEIYYFFRDQQVRLQPSSAEGGEYTHISAPLVNPEGIVNYCVFYAWGILVPMPEALYAKPRQLPPHFKIHPDS